MWNEDLFWEKHDAKLEQLWGRLFSLDRLPWPSDVVYHKPTIKWTTQKLQKFLKIRDGLDWEVAETVIGALDADR